MTILLYISVTLPLLFAGLMSGYWVDGMNKFIDIYFLVDLGMNFFIGYMNSDAEYVGDWRLTSMNYLKTRFIFDAVASVPGSFFSNDASFITKFFKLLRLFRMLKLVRIVQMNIIADSNINPGILALVKLLLQIAFASHIGGTFFWAIKQDDPDLSEFNIRNNLVNATNTDYYVAGLYYAVTTLATVIYFSCSRCRLIFLRQVGYGDIIPNRTVERAYSLALMLLGTVLFGTILNSIGEV